MLTKEFAHHFAAEWISAWNSHDLERVLSLYSENFAMSSPYIVQIAGETSGRLQGKDSVKNYWSKALELIPTLHFELVATLLGADSITLYYQGAHGMAAEVFFFDESLKVTKAFAHYN